MPPGYGKAQRSRFAALCAWGFYVCKNIVNLFCEKESCFTETSTRIIARYGLKKLFRGCRKVLAFSTPALASSAIRLYVANCLMSRRTSTGTKAREMEKVFKPAGGTQPASTWYATLPQYPNRMLC